MTIRRHNRKGSRQQVPIIVMAIAVIVVLAGLLVSAQTPAGVQITPNEAARRIEAKLAGKKVGDTFTENLNADELLKVAAANRLRQPDVLRAQVREARKIAG